MPIGVGKPRVLIGSEGDSSNGTRDSHPWSP